MVQLAAEGVSPGQMVLEWAADLRFEGQSWELTTPLVRSERLDQQGVQAMIEAFHELHQKVYSYSDRAQPVEFINLRVRPSGAIPRSACPHTG